MARGTQFSVLRQRLRAELRRATSVAVGVDDVDSLNVTLNHTYSTLYFQNDWPHLRKVFSLPLVAGERYYDVPTGLEAERIERVAVDWSGIPTDMEHGIAFEQMAEFDSDADERSDPALRWDIRWEDSATQIEVWPIPATAQTVRIQGIQSISRLVSDEDICLLDDDVVVLYAAAELTKGDDQKIKADMAREHLKMLKGRGHSNGVHRLGLGSGAEDRPHGVVVRVGS